MSHLISRFAGKFLGGLLGLVFLGPLGLLIGVILGHLFDQRLAANYRVSDLTGNAYAKALFLVLGKIAKADGVVSDREIATARQIMTQFGVFGQAKKQAIALFYQGKRGDFSLDDTLRDMLIFIKGNHLRLLHFFNCLMKMAYIHGEIDPNTSQLLREIAEKLNIRVNLNYYDSIFGNFHQQYQQHYHAAPPPRSSLKDAYAVLGISEEASMEEVKRAYRKLMSQYHPDKLMSQGLSEAEMQKATEKVQKIREAYERILAALE